ncbi:MAG: LysM peptidoglycan-binding domain-containing protein [Myxococcaceae bacterium]
MRTILLASLAALMLVPAAAFAQADDEETGGGGDDMPEGSATVAPEKGPSKSSATTGKASSPGTQHTVEKGDTLWDLSQRYLGSPWYWPKVWSYNPEIANPHWIYPGNEVRFYGSGEEVPTQVEAGAPETNVDESELYEEKVDVSGQIGFRPKGTLSVAAPGFVTNREVEEAGRIVGSFSEAEGLSYADHIYIDLKKAPRLGEIYLVFRNEGEIIHPITRNPMGYLTHILAEVKVVRVEKNNRAVVQIWKQYDEVRRSDLIGPVGEPVVRQVGPRPNERDVKNGVVVADTRVWPTTIGEHATVIIDKGADDGVKVGNTFTIFRQHDPLPISALLQPSDRVEGLPIEDVGQCIAFEVKAKATVCLMSRSLRDVTRGDNCEIRASSGRRASR